ncbi:MAG: hypothetical protein JWO09_3486 [Bacteroidetes bacterium]|nr:hypothetical protein [Bacteroidota bacterium]
MKLQKLYPILFLIVCFTVKSGAQTYINRVYNYAGTLSYNNSASGIYEYDNGDFMISGQKFYSAGFGALCFIRINAAGDTLYCERYPKPNCQYYCGASGAFIKTADSNLVQCGAYADSSGNMDALLVKLTMSGDTLWTRTYGGAQFDNANIVCQTPDSGFVLMGVTQSYSMGTASDFYLIKTDKNGNQQWQKNYLTASPEDCVSGQITLDGGYIMSGIRNGEIFVLKADVNGTFQWLKQFSGTAGTGFVKQLPDSSYLVVGAKSVAGYGYQAYMAKLNPSGSAIRWQKTYGGWGDQQFYTIPVVLADGSIVVSGESQLGAYSNGLLVKTDSAGNQTWLRQYYANPSNDNYIYELKATADNGFIMAGSGNISGQDAWVLKTDGFGCLVPDCSIGIEEEDNAGRLRVYPNPAGNILTVGLNEQDVDAAVELINVMGEAIKMKMNGTAIDISELSAGVYFLTITSRDGRQRSARFIKQ